MPSFLSTVIFPGLSCTLLPKGSVLSWAWAQAEGRASQGGPLPFQREGGRRMVISDIGSLGCWVVCAPLILPTRPSGSWGLWLCCLLQTPGRPSPAQACGLCVTLRKSLLL